MDCDKKECTLAVKYQVVRAHPKHVLAVLACGKHVGWALQHQIVEPHTGDWHPLEVVAVEKFTGAMDADGNQISSRVPVVLEALAQEMFGVADEPPQFRSVVPATEIPSRPPKPALVVSPQDIPPVMKLPREPFVWKAVVRFFTALFGVLAWAPRRLGGIVRTSFTAGIGKRVTTKVATKVSNAPFLVSFFAMAVFSFAYLLIFGPPPS